MSADFDPLALMELDVRALFMHDPAGRITAINKPEPWTPPRFFLGRTAAGNIWRVREDLPPPLVAELDRLARSELAVTKLETPPLHLRAYREAIAAHAPIQNEYAGPTYTFLEDPPPPDDSIGVERDDSASTFASPLMVVRRDGIVVASCESSRKTAEAAEAGVETHEAYRRRGYAAAAVAAWARATRAEGRIAFYGTTWDNVASQAIARRLGATMYGTDLHFT